MRVFIHAQEQEIEQCVFEKLIGLTQRSKELHSGNNKQVCFRLREGCQERVAKLDSQQDDKVLHLNM